MVITLFPLSVGPQPQLLARIAPGIIQVAALLACGVSSVSSCAWRSATARTSPARCGSS
ncbi:heme exporter protein CcmB [Salmonella enterica subsp. enterica serovar Weltevreden]|uniref:heme exporter protein CcmB n=1 Tax=Salmonella enterica TaxID=28901 RepID=UPI002A749689|nr:heme exporter protein CcmB [Salmonella enterica]MDY2509130.1 heme exporter protein CcmB [Salmonella enterica subsp. enterica serovar Weltevreden]